MTNQQQRPQGPSQLQRPAPGESKAAEEIRAIFRAQADTLAGLFPNDGATMVTRACSMALTAAKAPHLKTASPESIAETAVACMHLGLEFGDQAYAVPHKGQAGLIIGPRGLITLAFRSGFVKSIEARAVFDGDFFEYNLGDPSFIRHRKAMEGRRPVNPKMTEQAISHVYVIIETTTEGKTREVLTWEDIKYYRSFSKASSGPWFDNFEGMCRKTAIKRGLEFVPRSPLLAAALRETSEGAYQIPEEIMAAVRGRLDIHGDTGAPGDDPEQVKLGADGRAMREPGADG